MSQLTDFMDNSLKHGGLYTHTHHYRSGGHTQYLLMFDKHVKTRAMFKELSTNLNRDESCIHYYQNNNRYLMSQTLIRITPDMLPNHINKAITDWFYQYTLDNNLTDFTNEWWPKT